MWPLNFLYIIQQRDIFVLARKYQFDNAVQFLTVVHVQGEPYSAAVDVGDGQAHLFLLPLRLWLAHGAGVLYDTKMTGLTQHTTARTR